jgi:ribosome-binding factor A
MTSRRKSLREIASLVDEIESEDGVDPRHTRRTSSRTIERNRKIWQLCKQAAVALELALYTLDDPELGELRVARVEPAPDASRLLAVVCPARGATTTEDSALAALSRAEGPLRAAVAKAIHRKRAPGLTFGFVDGVGCEE